MGYAAQVMRSIVVDFVRRRSADRRGGAAIHVDLDVAAAHISDPRELEVLQIHEALQELEKIDPRLLEAATDPKKRSNEFEFLRTCEVNYNVDHDRTRQAAASGTFPRPPSCPA